MNAGRRCSFARRPAKRRVTRAVRSSIWSSRSAVFPAMRASATRLASCLPTGATSRGRSRRSGSRSGSTPSTRAPGTTSPTRCAAADGWTRPRTPHAMRWPRNRTTRSRGATWVRSCSTWVTRPARPTRSGARWRCGRTCARCGRLRRSRGSAAMSTRRSSFTGGSTRPLRGIPGSCCRSPARWPSATTSTPRAASTQGRARTSRSFCGQPSASGSRCRWSMPMRQPSRPSAGATPMGLRRSKPSYPRWSPGARSPTLSMTCAGRTSCSRTRGRTIASCRRVSPRSWRAPSTPSDPNGGYLRHARSPASVCASVSRRRSSMTARAAGTSAAGWRDSIARASRSSSITCGATRHRS